MRRCASGGDLVKDDPIRALSKAEIDRITGGGILRAIPLVKLWDMLRGRSRPVNAKKP